MNRIYKIGLSSVVALILLNGCTPSKQIEELKAEIKALKARLEAVEKIVLPSKPLVQETAYDLPIGESPVLGKQDAPVSITVFSNFQCPFCSRADKSLRGLLNDPELASKVNIVFKHFPFEKDRHPEARPAAKATLAAKEQGKFWEMAEKIFTNQGNLSAKNYAKWAKEIGLDEARFEKDLKDNDQKYDEMINKDKKLGEEVAKLEGTPWILVGGWLLEGNIDAATIKQMIADKKLQ